MVAIAPVLRRHRFIPERIPVHAEELAYLWQRRRASGRSPDIALRDFAYLQERIEAHLQGVSIAGDELGAMLDGFLHGDDRDEVFAAAWALLRSGRPDNARRVLEAFAAAGGPVIAGFADALVMAPAAQTEATLRAALVHGSPAHAAAAALALASHRRLDDPSAHLDRLLRHEEPSVAVFAWRALLVLENAPDVPLPCFAEALHRPVAALRRAVLEAAVIGVPDGAAGEAVKAIIVPRGAAPTVEAVRDYCRAHLTPYKVPRRIFVVDELPTSLIGKVLRRQVRESLLALTQPDR